MPWTFAHPAAVIPLRRYCPAPLSFPALVVGSISPDLGYHILRKDWAAYAHSLQGSLLVCLPAGLLLLALLCMLRRPLWYLLPEPHRSALEPVATTRISLGLSTVCWAALSVVLGAWTHVVWDALTHDNGWIVLRVALLQLPLIEMGGTRFHLFNVLQHVSTGLGLAVLVMTYSRWLSRVRGTAPPAYSRRGEGWRYGVIAAFALSAAVIALALASEAAENFHGSYAWHVFVFRGAVDGMSAFIALYLAGALLLYRARGMA